MINDPPGMNRPDWITMEEYLRIIKEALSGTLTVITETTTLTDDELRSTPIVVKTIEEIDSPNYNQDSLVDVRYAMDKTNQMPLYTEVSNPERRDEIGAIIPSDAPKQIVWNSISAINNPLVIDTTGYQSIVIQKSTAGIITPYTSNDGQVWYAVMGCLSSTPQTMTATLPAALGVYIFPVTGKYFKLVGPASEVRCLIYLRYAPMIPLGTIGTVSTVTTLSQFAGSAIVNAGVAGMLAVGGNIATGAAPTASPVQIGGVDEGRLITPSNTAANLTPKTRRLLVDERGRIIENNVDARFGGEANYQGTATANVRDVTSSEGQLQIEILQQILVEMRLLNHQIHEMANGTTTILDDLEMIRNSFSRVNYNA